MTVRELIEVLQKAKNQDAVVCVCDQGVPYRTLTGTTDNTGTVEQSERGDIDGVFLLFATDDEA